MASSFFGGRDTTQMDAQLESNQITQDFIERITRQAKQEALALFGPGVDASRGGFQSALDIQAQTIPQQFQAFQQGNIDAQNLQAGGMRGFRDAIMGNPIDMDSWQPNRIPIDTSFSQQQLPPSQVTPELQDALSGRNAPIGTTGFDYQNFLSQPGNRDILLAQQEAQWTRNPREWMERVWVPEAVKAGDPRYDQALQGIV